MTPQQTLGAIDHDDDDDHRDEHLNQPDEGRNFETEQGKALLDRSGELREEGDDCGAEDSAGDCPGTPNGQHGDDMEDKDQLKHMGMHRSDMVDPQRAADAHDETPDDEGVDLLSDHIDSQNSG